MEGWGVFDGRTRTNTVAIVQVESAEAKCNSNSEAFECRVNRLESHSYSKQILDGSFQAAMRFCRTPATCVRLGVATVHTCSPYDRKLTRTVTILKFWSPADCAMSLEVKEKRWKIVFTVEPSHGFLSQLKIRGWEMLPFPKCRKQAIFSECCSAAASTSLRAYLGIAQNLFPDTYVRQETRFCLITRGLAFS